MVNVDDIREYIENALSCSVAVREDGVLVCYVAAKDICSSLTILRDDPQTRFKLLTDIFAVDYPSEETRFEVIYMLLSLVQNVRMCVKVALSPEDTIQSVTSVYGSAGWLEREVFDMYGIKFQDHPDLRRILTDYGFKGHPMLKDFPLSGYEEIRYDFEKGMVAYKPVDLQQDFRYFSAMSPWKGDNKT